MKACVIMNMQDYENIRLRIQHAINILDHARVSKSDRTDALNSLRAVRTLLEEDDITPIMVPYAFRKEEI